MGGFQDISCTVPCGGSSIIWHQSFQPHYMYILYVLAHATFEFNGLSLHWVTLVRKQWIILTVLAFWDNFKLLHVSIIGATQFYFYKDSPIANVYTNYLDQAPLMIKSHLVEQIQCRLLLFKLSLLQAHLQWRRLQTQMVEHFLSVHCMNMAEVFHAPSIVAVKNGKLF